ncbi:nickel/cobalt transporter [Pararhizobium haloflavum]|uniref:nickel/cobalt transporter n=1 Tax=Pararhizobium haloflavum TaxID=2037914 RepID=UPI000C18A5D5|nr:ABC transporter permease [Pararhizobium haloflavum]
MLQTLIDLQREIYTAFADYIRAFSEDGNWLAFAGFLPMAIVFGAVHALTPGHSKAVLATYLVGSHFSLVRGLGISLALSATHVSMSILIAVFSLPLVSIAFGSIGRAPLLEDISRGMLLLIGLWMMMRAIRGSSHDQTGGRGIAAGVAAGLIPCPLTLFVMTFAMSLGVIEAGLAFALMMLAGVALTLSIVAVCALTFRDGLVSFAQRSTHQLYTLGRLLEGGAGVSLTAVGIATLFHVS